MDVVSVWTGRHANALLRALRLTNESFAARLGTATRTVAKWNANPDVEPTPEMQNALDTLLAQAPDDAKARFALMLRGEAAQAAASGSAAQDEADDIADLITQVTASNTTDTALEALSRATASLAESHTQAPASRVLKEVLRLHRQAQTLLQGRQRLSQRRELFRIESELLAHACLLLGDLKQDQRAEQYGNAALAFAREGGTSQALAWTVLAKTLRWQERLIESADMARQGFESSPLAPVKIQLASQEANAAALLGDATRAHEALRRAEETAAVAPADSGISAWSFPAPRQALFTLSVATETGDPVTALRAAAMADAAWAAGEPKVPATWAQIRVGAGIAHLHTGAVDGMIAEVTPVLTLPPELRMATVTAYISRLGRQLARPRFNGSKVVDDLLSDLREFNAGALSPE